MYDKNEAANPPPSKSDGTPAKSGRTFRAHLDSCRMDMEEEMEGPESPAKEAAEGVRGELEEGKY